MIQLRPCYATSDDGSHVDVSDGSTAKPTKKKGDSLRDATGIRPSLHPTTINCIAEALLLRSQCVLGEILNVSCVLMMYDVSMKFV